MKPHANFVQDRSQIKMIRLRKTALYETTIFPCHAIFYSMFYMEKM
jgi:hypothetical protein